MFFVEFIHLWYYTLYLTPKSNGNPTLPLKPQVKKLYLHYNYKFRCPLSVSSILFLQLTTITVITTVNVPHLPRLIYVIYYVDVE